MMKFLAILFLVAAAVTAQTALISDTLTAAAGGGAWTGRITVALNNPGAAQPLYSGTTSLAGWTRTLCLGVTGSDCSAELAPGQVMITLYANIGITPAGTSYSARFTPTRGTAWAETWIATTGSTKLYQIRSNSVPSPAVMFSPSQLSGGGATNGQCLAWNGSAWVPGTCGGGAAGLTWAQLNGITWSQLQ